MQFSSMTNTSTKSACSFKSYFGVYMLSQTLVF